MSLRNATKIGLEFIRPVGFIFLNIDKSMKATLFFLLIFTANVSNAQDNSALKEAQQMPYFQGCEELPNGSPEKRNCSNQKLVGFIAKNLNYPARAKSEGIEGTVYVSFTVNERGVVGESKLLHDIGGDCGNEAIRVVNMMPPFQAAVHDKKTVKVELNLPVRFNLSDRENNKAEGYTLSWGALKGSKVSRIQLRENVGNQVQIRDQKGNSVLIDELVFSFEKKNKAISEKSRGELNNELKKVIYKAKKGGLFTVSASVQSNGEFLYIDRSFEVVE